MYYPYEFFIFYRWYFEGNIKTFELNGERFIMDKYGIHRHGSHQLSLGWAFLKQYGTFRPSRIISDDG